jgi:hypothetical protein
MDVSVSDPLVGITAFIALFWAAIAGIFFL